MAVRGTFWNHSGRFRVGGGGGGVHGRSSGLPDYWFSVDGGGGVPTLSSKQEDAEDIAFENPDLGVHTEISGSRNKLDRGKGLAGRCWCWCWSPGLSHHHSCARIEHNLQ